MKTTINSRFLGAFEVDSVDFTDEVNAYVFAYGWKQTVDDAGATKGRASIVAWWDKWRGWHVIVDGRPISNFLAAHKVLEANYLAARAA